jgi:hypothetical protein
MGAFTPAHPARGAAAIVARAAFDNIPMLLLFTVDGAASVRTVGSRLIRARPRFYRALRFLSH